jgi:hypothetical protein
MVDSPLSKNHVNPNYNLLSSQVLAIEGTNFSKENILSELSLNFLLMHQLSTANSMQ